jgi:hypothetical protein
MVQRRQFSKEFKLESESMVLVARDNRRYTNYLILPCAAGPNLHWFLRETTRLGLSARL